MIFANLLVTSEWLFTLGFVAFVGYVTSTAIGQLYALIAHSSTWTLFNAPTLDTLMKMLG